MATAQRVNSNKNVTGEAYSLDAQIAEHYTSFTKELGRAILMAVAGFVDWENIRLRLADNYTEKVPVTTILGGLEKVAHEIGTLQSCAVFGDWSLRREEAQQIQNNITLIYDSRY